MLESVRGSFRVGTPWTCRIGIRGIRAARLGAESSRLFAVELEQHLGAYSRSHHFDTSADLPPMHLLEVDRMLILWVAGAQSARHGQNVIDGLVETWETAGNTGLNSRVASLMNAALENHLGIRDRVDEVILFGHSYGGVCVEAYASALARSYPGVFFNVTTYGAPRCCIPRRMIPQTNLGRRRIVSTQDVVPHVPFNSRESPIASRITPTRFRTVFDNAGHTTGCQIFEDDGTFAEADNNTVAARDSALTILSWVTYAQHITHRAHEEGTYVSLMDAWAARGPDGLPPTAEEPRGPEEPRPPGVPNLGGDVTGPEPNPDDHAERLRQKEELAEQLARSLVSPEPARPVSQGSVHGVQFRGAIRVEASDRRAARTASKRLNRLRRILSPCSTDQRAQLLEALELDIEGPV